LTVSLDNAFKSEGVGSEKVTCGSNYFFLDKQLLKINQKVKFSPQASNSCIGLLYPFSF